MSQQHYAVTGVWRGIGAEIAMALRSHHPVTGFDVAQPSVGLDDFIHLDLSDAAAIHVGCVQDLAAARPHRMTDGELP
jgi:hypothetical protein